MSRSVVLADDEVPLRTLLRRLITRDGRLEVVGEAGNGEEAVQLVQQLDPDVLLLDLGMPLMDGLEVLAQLQPRSRPRIVVLTGFADPNTRTRVEELGAAACVLKGRDFAGLVELLVQQAEQRG